MKKYDLVVVGGGTAGCAAAYTAGKLGLSTLLIEKNIHLGGSMTSGLVIPAMNAGENQINTDFFESLVSKMEAIGGQITYNNNKGWFNPELLKIVLDSMMIEAGVDIAFQASIQHIDLESRLIRRVYLNKEILLPPIDKLQNGSKQLFEPIETRYLIDATGYCEIGKMCGCNFLEDKSLNQPISLRFIMGNVNLEIFAAWLREFDKGTDVTTIQRINGNLHLSTAYTWDNKNWALKPLFDDAVDKGILKDTDRNYFQIFTVAGMPDSVAFNCPRILDCQNCLSVNEVSKALISARASIFRLLEFCKIYLKGFENAYISNISDALGVRVSARIKGKYVYTIEDLKSGKMFKNSVLKSNYPVDVHSVEKDKSVLEKVNEYSLPVETLMSEDIENLFVAGRCLSADFMAQGALRIQPSCFSMGEGISKYIAKVIDRNI